MSQHVDQEYMACFDRWNEAHQKFEYYFTGLIGAITTYLLTQSTSDTSCSCILNFEIWGLIFFCLSLGCSISRLSKNVTFLRMTTGSVPKEKMHAHLKTKPDDEPAHDPETLAEVSEGEFQTKLNHLKDVIDKANSDMGKLENNIQLLFYVRNVTFLLGIISFLISKI